MLPRGPPHADPRVRRRTSATPPHAAPHGLEPNPLHQIRTRCMRRPLRQRVSNAGLADYVDLPANAAALRARDGPGNHSRYMPRTMPCGARRHRGTASRPATAVDGAAEARQREGHRHHLVLPGRREELRLFVTDRVRRHGCQNETWTLRGAGGFPTFAKRPSGRRCPAGARPDAVQRCWRAEGGRGVVREHGDDPQAVEDAFAFLADFENIPKWNHAIVETTKVSPGPARVVTSDRQTRSAPSSSEEAFEVTVFEPASRGQPRHPEAAAGGGRGSVG